MSTCRKPNCIRRTSGTDYCPFHTAQAKESDIEQSGYELWGCTIIRWHKFEPLVVLISDDDVYQMSYDGTSFKCEDAENLTEDQLLAGKIFLAQSYDI